MSNTPPQPPAPISAPLPATTPAGVPAFTPVPRKLARHDGWTPERQRSFIAALAETGSVTAAARRAGMGSESAYVLRREPGGEEFAAAWAAALECGAQRLEDVAMERALNGVEVPVYSYGHLVGSRRDVNDRLLMFMLRHRLPDRFGGNKGVRSGSGQNASASASASTAEAAAEQAVAEAEAIAEALSTPRAARAHMAAALATMQTWFATRRELMEAAEQAINIRAAAYYRAQVAGMELALAGKGNPLIEAVAEAIAQDANAWDLDGWHTEGEREAARDGLATDGVVRGGQEPEPRDEDGLEEWRARNLGV